MRSDICSIPVAEVFEPKDGCPICRMRDMLEERMLEYIMGAAMMEPDVRIQTNKEGFCFTHYKKMLGRRNRLSVALMMESHLKEIEKKVFGGFLSTNSGKGKAGEKMTESCFVCHQVENGMTALVRNTMILYENDREFRKLFAEQPQFCLPHYALLTEAADKNLSKKYRSQCKDDLTKITLAALQELHKDVKHFCDMYDYRNNTEDADWGNSRDSLERTTTFLTTRDPEKK
ncbi:MAG: hypothetical protein IKT68_00440 [Clostridia bacterium]|nr:hypothetical protein [Clostridia bacterium]